MLAPVAVALAQCVITSDCRVPVTPDTPNSVPGEVDSGIAHSTEVEEGDGEVATLMFPRPMLSTLHRYAVDLDDTRLERLGRAGRRLSGSRIWERHRAAAECHRQGSSAGKETDHTGTCT
ncbi:hypothetical protein [Kribbella sp. NPDC055071]